MSETLQNKSKVLVCPPVTFGSSLQSVGQLADHGKERFLFICTFIYLTLHSLTRDDYDMMLPSGGGVTR